MLSGRGLFLLFFATLLTISIELPIRKINETKLEETDEPQKEEGDKKDKDKEVTPGVNPSEDGKDEEEEKEEIEEGIEIEKEGVTVGVIDNLPTKNKNKIEDEGKKDYNDGSLKEDHLQKVDANNAYNEFRKRIIKNKLIFQSSIDDLSNPRDVSKLSGKTFKCHHHKIPIEYACNIEYTLGDYSEYEHFIKHFNMTIPKVVKSRSRIVKATEPCHALYEELTGRLIISCGCDYKEYHCKLIGNRPAKFVEFLKFKSGGKMKLTRTPGEKALIFVHKYILYIISAILGLIILIILLVISIVEWKGMQKNESKRRERVSKLSQRVERSRNSLRTTCSETSDPRPEYEYSAFQQLMKKR